MPFARLALAGAAATTAVVLTGCGQDPVANDNPGAQRDRTVVEPTIIRTPVQVEEAPSTVPLPGVTGGPQGEAQTDVTFSPGPRGEQAETDEG